MPAHAFDVQSLYGIGRQVISGRQYTSLILVDPRVVMNEGFRLLQQKCCPDDDVLPPDVGAVIGDMSP